MGTAKPRKRLRVHWLLVGTTLCLLLVGLVAQAPLKVGVENLYTPVASGVNDAVPPSVLGGGPGIGSDQGNTRTFMPSERTIALTFDDGPDPEWTPKILAVLTKHGVTGTFFVLGDQSLKHPELLRTVRAQGSELGLHSFSHVNLDVASAWRGQFELRLNQLGIAGATGENTAVMRPPYSSTNRALDNNSWATAQSTAELGYVTVLTTLDGRDWSEPGIDAIVDNITPPDSEGQIVLLHDSGGDRDQTVAALDTIIPQLQSEGWRFTTASDAMGLSNTAGVAPAATVMFGSILLWGFGTSHFLVTVVIAAMVLGGIVAVGRALMLMITARRHKSLTAAAIQASITDPVSVIVPAYNEEAGIEAAVRSLLASTHPVQVVVVDDGSTDRTSEVVTAMNLEEVLLIRQENAGKPAALNAGLAAAEHDLIVMVDGDTVFEPETITNLIRPFADPQVGAVSGNAKVANRGGLLGRWQHIEYVIGFNMDRRWYDLAKCMPTVPGAVGGWRAKALRDVGGVSDDTLAEDTDLTMSIGRAGWRVVFTDDAVAWTEAPASLRALWRQRYRWCYGTLQALWKHRHGVLERGRAGSYSRRSASYMLVFQTLLPLLAPAVDVFAIYGLLFRDPLITAAIWLAFQSLDLIVGLYAFRLDRESLRVLWTLPLTQLCYRQMMCAVVIHSLVTAVSGIRLPWQRMERYGTFAATTSTT